jgi:hypothetical protein
MFQSVFLGHFRLTTETVAKGLFRRAEPDIDRC